MLWASIILFAIAALGGVVLAVLRISNRPLPLPLAVVHGLVAATALVIFIVTIVGSAMTPTTAAVALILFLIAAIGGAVLFSLHLSGKKLPLPLVLGHGLLAVVAFILLLIRAIG
jgi:hypothetical protein